MHFTRFSKTYKHECLNNTLHLLDHRSCLMISGYGTCRPARATPSSLLMETVSSQCSCTAASSKSCYQCRVRSQTTSKAHARGHWARRRVIPSDPPYCPSVLRYVNTTLDWLYERWWVENFPSAPLEFMLHMFFIVQCCWSARSRHIILYVKWSKTGTAIFELRNRCNSYILWTNIHIVSNPVFCQYIIPDFQYVRCDSYIDHLTVIERFLNCSNL